MNAIFEGLTVVEVGPAHMSGSLAGMFLADYGARVVKLEPLDGDTFRLTNPSGFLVWNRGKGSVAIDLASEDGRRDAFERLSLADVVIDTFKEGEAEFYGLGYENVAQMNPTVVYCCIRGFSSGGAYADLSSDEAIVGAKSGFFNLPTEYTTPPYREGPIFEGMPMGSFGAGMLAAAGIASALRARELTGEGTRVEATVVQGLAPFNYHGLPLRQYAEWNQQSSVDGSDVSLTSASDDSDGDRVARYTRHTFSLCTADGQWLRTQVLLPHQSAAMLRALGLDDLLQETRFANAPDFETFEDAEEYVDRLWRVVRTRTKEEWFPSLWAESDFPFEFAGPAEAVLEHPQMRHNGNVIVVDDPTVGPITQLGALARFGDSEPIVLSAPALGEERFGRGEKFSWQRPDDEVADLKASLAGLTVIEFGYFYAMPFACTILGSLGARVIKLEGLNGDPWRNAGAVSELVSSHVLEGKESVAIDLRDPAGLEAALSLIASADVFIQGFRPGVAERLGIDRDDVCARNPRLIYVDALGYGADGPYADKPTYAHPAAAVAGADFRHAAFWLDPGLTQGFSVEELQAIVGPRLISQVPGDAAASLVTAAATTAAIYRRERSGTGEYLRTDMVHANALCFSDEACLYVGKEPRRATDPEFYGTGPLYRLYETTDGWIFLRADSTGAWSDLKEVAQRSGVELADSDGVWPGADTDPSLEAALEKLFAGKSAAQWEAAFVGSRADCVRSFDGTASQFTLSDTVMRESGQTTTMHHPAFGEMLRHGPLVEMSRWGSRIDGPSTLGQQTEQILAELGFGATDIETMRQRGVIL